MDNKNLKLYVGNDIIPFNPNSICFEIEKDRWIFTEVFEDSDIIPVIYYDYTNMLLLKEKYKPNQMLLLLDIFHGESWMGIDDHINIQLGPYKDITNKILYVHQNKKNKSAQFVYYDIMFNREKLYFTDHDKIPNLDEKTWTYNSNKEMYSLSPINKILNKIFLSPIRIYNNEADQDGNFTLMSNRMLYRKKLKNLLSNFLDIGWTSGDSNFDLLPNNPTQDFLDKKNNFGNGFYPVSDYYYNNSLVNIYIETIVDQTSFYMITEKTFDPLIKGNFILPFGNRYHIEYIKEYRFKFPSWIDYSYDIIKDDEERFISYCHSVKKLLSISNSELYQRALKDIDILTHNREIFFKTPYDQLYNKIVECIHYNQQKNWSYE